MAGMTPELAHALMQVRPADLGVRIKAARVAAGLTQPELGGAEASAAYLSRIERGERRPAAEVLEVLALRLGVTLESLIIGEDWEDVRELELLLDHAELALAGGEAPRALDLSRQALASSRLHRIADGADRARWVEASAMDALGDPGAITALTELAEDAARASTRLRSATALSRIRREQGQLDRSITIARSALGEVPEELRGSEDAIRLSVTLAAALFVDGRTAEAAEICEVAIAESERLDSPVARASAYWNASAIRAAAGETGEAIDLARRALLLLEETERVRDTGRLRMQLGLILMRDDPAHVDDAREQFARAGAELEWSAASLADRLRNDILQAQAAHLVGDLNAAEAAASAVRDAAGTELPLLSAEALVLLGQVAWSRMDPDQAHTHFRQAIIVLTGLGADHEAAQLWFELGAAADDSGLVEEARDAYRRAAASTGIRTRFATSPQVARV